jgi:DNA (cytosine-5)-methyltransferase 1
VVDGDRMRMLTVEEALAFQGFPRTYKVPQKREDWTQAVGNAIPPVLAEAAMAAVMEAG